MLCDVSLHSDLLGRILGELARRREEHQQFARRIGWSQSKMSRTLNGKTGLPVGDLEEMLRGLGIDPREMDRWLRMRLEPPDEERG